MIKERFSLKPIILVGIISLLSFSSISAYAQGESNWDVEFIGDIEFEGRIFNEAPLHQGQKRHSFSLAFEPTLFIEHAEGYTFILKPNFRTISGDNNSLSVDIREAYLLTLGSIGDTEWELRLGIDQVFWGTVESNNLVNIINQTDFATDPSGDSKLGQPMVQGTLFGEWGTLSLFILPYHRPRTFPSEQGRLRLDTPIDDNSNLISYSHPSGKRHIGFAARYSNSIGLLDYGVSGFKGTSREPFLVPFFPIIQGQAPTTRIGCEPLPLPVSAPNLPQPVPIIPKPSLFLQCYNQIEQFGLDLQLTLDELLLKAEAINRNGFDAFGYKSNYNAFVIGGEYSFYGFLETDADLTLFAEWSQDERRALATTPLQNDLFLGVRYALNDTEDTSFFAGIIDDLDYTTRSLSLNAKRRISDSVSLEISASTFLNSDERDLQLWSLRDDGHIAFKLNYGF